LSGGSDVLLDGKIAVVYGGGGAIGGAVAQAFAVASSMTGAIAKGTCGEATD